VTTGHAFIDPPNAALSGRGERTRAAGPLERKVGQALHATAPTSV
jgi:hypothetical protein